MIYQFSLQVYVPYNVYNITWWTPIPPSPLQPLPKRIWKGLVWRIRASG
jgi:hypothetical protein